MRFKEKIKLNHLDKINIFYSKGWYDLKDLHRCTVAEDNIHTVESVTIKHSVPVCRFCGKFVPDNKRFCELGFLYARSCGLPFDFYYTDLDVLKIVSETFSKLDISEYGMSDFFQRVFVPFGTFKRITPTPERIIDLMLGQLGCTQIRDSDKDLVDLGKPQDNKELLDYLKKKD